MKRPRGLALIGCLLAGAALGPAAIARAAWEPVQRPAAPGALTGPYNETELEPSLAVSPTGEQLLAWNEGTSLEVVSRPRGGAWGEPLAVTTVPDLLGGPGIRFDPVDGAVLTWATDHGWPPPMRTSTRRPDGTWTDPEDVMQKQPYAHTFRGPAGHSAHTWEEATASGQYKYKLMVMTRPPGGSWSEPETLASDGPLLDGPSIVFNARGDAIAVWDNWDDQSMYAFRPSGGDWSAPVRFFTDAAHRWNWVTPSVAMDPAGNVLAVRADDGSLRAAYRPFGGDFGAAHVLTTQNAGGLVSPLVAVDSAGRATIVWRQLNRVWVADRLPDGTFTDPTPLTPPTENAMNPQLSILSGGTRLVLEEQPQGSSDDPTGGSLVAYVRPPGGSFDAGTTLAAEGAHEPALSNNAVAWARVYPNLGCSEIETTSWVSGDPGPQQPARPHCNVADDASTQRGGPGASPGSNAGPALTRDRTAPRLAISMRRHQRALTTKRLKLAASSDESCKLLVTANLGGKRTKLLGRSRSSLRRGKRIALRLRLHGAAFKQLRAADARRRVKLTLTATDASGNRRSVARTVVLAH